MTSWNIRAVLFDMDGVVVDSLQLHLDSWTQVLKEMGAKRESLDVRRHFGHATRVLLRELLVERDDGRRPTRDEIEFWYRRKLAVTLELVPRAAQPVPGFVEFVQRVRARGLPTALASAATAPFVDAVLDKIGARGHFDALLTLDDVTQPKPHPEIFIKAAGLLNIPIKDCLVIEDSHPGIEAGVASGAVCGALLTMLAAEEVRGAHVVAQDYDELWRWLEEHGAV
jgi:HAD superfamily hydrolase (TIGR01509 family)